MVYDKENRLAVHEQGSVKSTYSYDGDGLKRTEQVGSGITSLVWDSTEYLQARS